jgi:hypothetical protein
MDAFELRLDFTPYEWKGPVVEVLDTAETVVVKLQTIEVAPDPVLIAKLTELILKRKDKDQDL